jgi:hypothetical protein
VFSAVMLRLWRNIAQNCFICDHQFPIVNADQNQIITFDHEVRGKFPLGKLVLTTSQVDPQLDRSVRAIPVEWL